MFARRQQRQQIGNTLLVETGCHMHNIGVVVIDQGTPAPELIAAGTYDGIDESVQAAVDQESHR